tara:strand:+ start:83 stop:265 length:183 start_codon:yes stop_codon:yes gene_type:complete
MKFDTGTELPDNFVLTKEFSDVYNLINDTNVNLLSQEKQVQVNQHYLNISDKIQIKILLP